VVPLHISGGRSIKPICLLVALLVCTTLPIASCKPAESRPGDILLITIDTLRADHLGLYGYERDTSPHIDKWFGEHAVYLKAYAAEASTSPSVASILSGQRPQEHGVRMHFQLLDEDVALVPQMLPPEWQTAAFVSNIVLTDEAIGIADRFDHYDDFVDQRESSRAIFERKGARTTMAALQWLREERDPDRPAFVWVHYIDPHGPYDPPRNWELSFDHEPEPIEIERVPEYIRVPGVDDGARYVERYDAEIAYVDEHVGRLLSTYAHRFPIEDALVVLTADHGESMMEHEEWFRHGYQVYDEVVRVPLLLRGPGVEPGRVTIPVSGVDLATTLLAFAGVPWPEHLPAVDLRRPSSLAPDRIVYTEAGAGFQRQWRAAVAADSKVTALVEGKQGEVTETRIYDLAADPDELDAQTPSELHPLVVLLLTAIEQDPDPSGTPSDGRAGTRITAPKVGPRASDEDLDALRALGYVK
jgi:arylsulfatase A-like enzyme